MRSLALLTLLALAGTSQNAMAQQSYHPACFNAARTQADMTTCAGDSYKVVDSILQVAVQERRDSLAGARRAQFDSTQGAWSAYATIECQFQASYFRDGTMMSMQELFCRGQLGTARLQALVRSLCDETRAQQASCPAARRYALPASLADPGD
jgi:uncharacterized protein YecT (DUF1311 family)